MRLFLLIAALLFLISCTPEPEPNGGELCKANPDYCMHQHKEPSE